MISIVSFYKSIRYKVCWKKKIQLEKKDTSSVLEKIFVEKGVKTLNHVIFLVSQILSC